MNWCLQHKNHKTTDIIFLTFEVNIYSMAEERYFSVFLYFSRNVTIDLYGWCNRQCTINQALRLSDIVNDFVKSYFVLCTLPLRNTFLVKMYRHNRYESDHEKPLTWKRTYEALTDWRVWRSKIVTWRRSVDSTSEFIALILVKGVKTNWHGYA